MGGVRDTSLDMRVQDKFSDCLFSEVGSFFAALCVFDYGSIRKLTNVLFSIPLYQRFTPHQSYSNFKFLLIHESFFHVYLDH